MSTIHMLNKYKKGKDIVIEPALSLYWLDDTIVMSFPPAWPIEGDTSPCIEVFALEGMTRKHEIDRMVRVLFETMSAMDTYNSKHERYNIRIEVEDWDNDKSASESTDEM
jgi:hypothetical protein